LNFYDKYQIEENDTKATYRKGSKKAFLITFKTDKGSFVKNKSIKVDYDYDYNAHLESIGKVFTLNENNTIIISYKNIPNLNKLASIRIEYLLNFTAKRYKYLTENNTVNRKEKDIPNKIEVEFVEEPKKEIVYRTFKTLVKDELLKIVSNSNTNTKLPDYYDDIKFEDSYSLLK
jgi:hypothetical protein